MTDFQYNIRLAAVEDAERLAPLAIKIFNDTFAADPLNQPEDMKTYIEEAFTLEQIRDELADSNTITFLVETDSEMIGFAKLYEHSKENCVSDLDPIELQRFYISREYHGFGAAQKLMNECLSASKVKNYRTIWLGVWEYNYRAHRFYEKIGFQKVGTHIFQLGSDPQTDWVMEMKL